MSLAAATGTAARTEEVTISDFSLHILLCPASTNVLEVSFKITGDDAQDVLCAFKRTGDDAKDALCNRGNLEFPGSHPGIYACDEGNYSFLLLEPENAGNEYALMIYHDVGDSHADLRGELDLVTRCTSNDGGSTEDWTCTQLESVTFTIDGPVGSSPGDEI
jgi:hypothetical protein